MYACILDSYSNLRKAKCRIHLAMSCTKASQLIYLGRFDQAHAVHANIRRTYVVDKNEQRFLSFPFLSFFFFKYSTSKNEKKVNRK